MYFRNLLPTLAGALLFCFLVGCGAENKPEASQQNAGDVLNDIRLRKLSKDVSLTGEQETKVKALLDEEGKAVARVQEDPNLSILDKATKVTALRDETSNKIKPLLTPEQLGKFEEVLRKAAKRKRER